MESANTEESTLTVRLDTGLLRDFKVVAARQGRPMSEIIREFIQWYITKEATK